MTFALRYAILLRGGTDNSPLLSDAYKWAMAQAGAPLRWEDFYLHFRKGNALLCPFDFREVIKHLRPRLPNSRERAFLASHGFDMTPAMDAALRGGMDLWGWDEGSWVNPQEPVLRVGAPQFLASWLEALSIAFQFPMQVATAMTEGVRWFSATCEDEAAIINLVAESLDLLVHIEVEVDEDLFRRRIRSRIRSLSGALGGDIHRAFEVGTRAMSCYQQHRIILEECKAAGIFRTANVRGAYDLNMEPVGTTGHEHQQRWGNDRDAFRAVRDMRADPPSYLFDTYNAMGSGIPAAIKVMRETPPDRPCSVRFDSGDQEAQLDKFIRAERRYGVKPNYLFMDGYDHERVGNMEAFVESFAESSSSGAPLVVRQRRHYGLGSFFNPTHSDYTRSTIAMVYKVCQSGGRPTMKYSEKGKESIPGLPEVFLLPNGQRIIGQAGDAYEVAGLRPVDPRAHPILPSIKGESTIALINDCYRRDFGGDQ